MREQGECRQGVVVASPEQPRGDPAVREPVAMVVMVVADEGGRPPHRSGAGAEEKRAKSEMETELALTTYRAAVAVLSSCLRLL